NRLLSGSYDETIKLWDTRTGALIETFQGHSASVYSVAFSPDGRRVVSGSDDTTIRFWNAATAQPLASLFSSPDGEWLALTPAGLFAASRREVEVLIIVRGLDITTIGQVHQSLFNPDLVRETLAGDPDGEVQEAAKVINLEKVVDSGPAPVVTITSPRAGS